VDVLTPRSLDEALALKSEQPGTVPIQGGTDLMVALNFDRIRPEVVLNLNELAELRGWSRENGTLRLGAGLTYTEAMRLAEPLLALAEASRTVGGPQIRNRGTIGGNLGTASPAGDALPPLLVYGAEVELAGSNGSRRLPLEEFLVGPKRNALAEDLGLQPDGAVPVDPRPRRVLGADLGQALVLLAHPAVQEPHGVALVAARRDALAAERRLPGRVGPLDRAAVGHGGSLGRVVHRA